MKLYRLLMTGVVILAIFSIAASTVLAQGPAPVDEGVSVDFPSSPYVVYPKDEDIFDTTPLFRFTDYSDFGATKYRIDVWAGDDLLAVPLYTYKGVGDCDGTECTMQPGIPLKKADYFGHGDYTWRVRAKVAGEWPVLWSQAQFTVLSSGFTSYFNTLDRKWIPLHGTWTVNSKGYMKTLGVTGSMSSVVEKHLFEENYMYEVKLKRKTEVESYSMIIICGNPMELNADGYWYDGYMYGINNDGNWYLTEINEGLITQHLSGFSASIKPFDWNKLTVWKYGNDINLWINGDFIGAYNDETFSDGFVGFGMFEEDTEKSALLVDKARLEYTDTPPYPMP